MTTKTVRAKSPGFYNGSRVREGAIFQIPEKQKMGKWMELVEQRPAPVRVPPKAPVTQPPKGGTAGLV